MDRPNDPKPKDSWAALEIYRQRYDIEGELKQVHSLERSISRRKARAHALQRRLDDLKTQLADAEYELEAIQNEISGARRAGGLLLDEILEQVKNREGEGWSPAPVLGYRAWYIMKGGVFGAKVQWKTPELAATCLNRVDGEDIPHSIGKCGPPACGIYAAKDLTVLQRELGLKVMGPIVGVVGLSGKVVEHDHGYRASAASVFAIAGLVHGKRFATDDPDEIADVFAEPDRTIERLQARAVPLPQSYLEQWKENHESWIWDLKSGSSR